jgi:hypothetical protein
VVCRLTANGDDAKAVVRIFATTALFDFGEPFHSLLPRSICRKEHRSDKLVRSRDIEHKYSEFR